MFAPSSANSAGALHRPVKGWPVRHLIPPRPKSPPTPNANFRTDGITITHSALLSRSLGIQSGMSMISLKTWPHVARRFCSRVWSAAKAGHASKVATMRALGFFMAGLLCLILLAPSVGDNWPGEPCCPIRYVDYHRIVRDSGGISRNPQITSHACTVAGRGLGFYFSG